MSQSNFFQRLWVKLNDPGTHLSSVDRAFFLENLSTMIRSGLDMASTLEAIRREAKSAKMKAMVAKIQDDVNAGVSFTSAMAKYHFLPTYSMSLIKAGEKSARFAENLAVIVEQQQKDAEFRAKIKGAMIYPVIVLIVAVVVGVALSWFVLPKLMNVFSNLRVQMPLTTRILIYLGAFIGKYGTVAVPSFLATFFGTIYIIFFYHGTRILGQRLIMHTPGFKRVILESELARFGYLLGTLLEAGLPILDCLEALKESSIYVDYQRLYAHLQTNIELGFSFEQAFATYKHSEALIPASVQQMMITGEQTGNLAKALTNVGLVYEKKIENTTKNLSTLIEPMILLVIFAGVMFLALAIIQPIYGLLSGIK
jgi:type IV pilus assembly protein PilC